MTESFGVWGTKLNGCQHKRHGKQAKKERRKRAILTLEIQINNIQNHISESNADTKIEKKKEQLAILRSRVA